MTKLDARGLSCPEPVIRTRKAIAAAGAGETIAVLVETVTSRENVRRAAQSMGCRVTVDDAEDGFCLTIEKS